MIRHSYLFVAAALLTASPAIADAITFRTPSDNIHCSFFQYEGDFVACEIRDRNNNVPILPRPSDCDLEWGDRIEMASDQPPTLSCHGDTIRSPDAQVLQYGSKMEHFGITCRSDEKGVTCTNTAANGFFVSRAKQQLF